MALYGEASKEEQRSYYQSEWSIHDLPAFVTDGISSREFAFDHDGSGPNDRYNVIRSPDDLAKYLLVRAPYSAYCSVAFYRHPERREGMFRTELAFDIDAKDLPVRSCQCSPGNVCEVCLNDAKQLALDYIDALRGDLALREIYLVYSGRGYHIRALDPSISVIGSSGRRKILDYVSGGRVPGDLFMEGGYSALFRRRISWILRRARKENLSPLPSTVSNRAIKEKEQILNALSARDRIALNNLLGEKRLGALLGFLSTLAASLTDAKVTMDEKRIIRLPSSLHSKVSMKCMLVKDPNDFEPMRDAVPEFVHRRKGTLDGRD